MLTLSGSRRVRIGVIADAHAAPADAAPYVWQNTVDLPHSIELLDAGVRWLAEESVDALVLLGDLTESADPASFAAVGERATALGVPVLAVPGNCDVDWETRSLNAFDALVQDLARAEQRHNLGSIQSPELVYLQVDDGQQGLRGVLRLPQPATGNGARLVLTHYPVLEMESDLLAAGFRHSGDLTNRAEIEAVLRAVEQPVVVIHGHLHVHDARISGNLLHLSCGALIEPPHFVSIIDLALTGDAVTVSRSSHSVRDDAIARLPVFAPLSERWHWIGKAWSPLRPPTNVDRCE